MTHFADVALVRPLAAQSPANYTYTVIADLTNCDGAGSPVLNNQGEAAFVGHCHAPIGPAGGAQVVRRGSGGALADIYTATPGATFGVPDSVISINDHGAVAFPGWDGSRHAILVGNGGPATPVVDTAVHTQFQQLLRPSINNSGAVAFMAVTTSSGYDTVAMANAGNIVTIAGPGTPTSSIGVLTAAIEPALNNNGVAAFIGQGLTNFGLFTGSGGPLTPISMNESSSFAGINDLGRVAFVSNTGAVRWADGGPAMTVASFPTYQQFGGLAAINNASVVAFQAQLGSGVTGIFIGPNPTTDTVIKSGDVIPGVGTVAFASMSEEAINDAGQVAFAALFQQGSGPVLWAIIRADPLRTATMTTLGISPSPGVLGQPVTLTASVAPTSGVASGQVQFFDGATLLGTASLVNGIASLQTSALALGSHRLLAAFAGSSGFLPSTSPAVPLIIDRRRRCRLR